MPKAGFWAIGGAEISFGSDGIWYADGESIANRRIAELFSRHVCRGDDGGERGSMPARFLRPAYYALARSMTVAGDAAVLETGGRRYRVARRPTLRSCE